MSDEEEKNGHNDHHYIQKFLNNFWSFLSLNLSIIPPGMIKIRVPLSYPCST